VAGCVSSCDVCTECRAAVQHSVHTPQPETHAATILHNLRRCISNDYFYKGVTLARLSISSLRMVQLDRNM